MNGRPYSSNTSLRFISPLVGNLKPSGVDYLETWEAMEGFVNEGLVRAIGVSNFSLKQLKRLLQNCKIKPAVLQIEVNAFWVDKGETKYSMI